VALAIALSEDTPVKFQVPKFVFSNLQNRSPQIEDLAEMYPEMIQSFAYLQNHKGGEESYDEIFPMRFIIELGLPNGSKISRPLKLNGESIRVNSGSIGEYIDLYCRFFFCE